MFLFLIFTIIILDSCSKDENKYKNFKVVFTSEDLISDESEEIQSKRTYTSNNIAYIENFNIKNKNENVFLLSKIKENLEDQKIVNYYLESLEAKEYSNKDLKNNPDDEELSIYRKKEYLKENQKIKNNIKYIDIPKEFSNYFRNYKKDLFKDKKSKAIDSYKENNNKELNLELIQTFYTQDSKNNYKESVLD